MWSLLIKYKSNGIEIAATCVYEDLLFSNPHLNSIPGAKPTMGHQIRLFRNYLTLYVVNRDVSCHRSIWITRCVSVNCQKNANDITGSQRNARGKNVLYIYRFSAVSFDTHDIRIFHWYILNYTIVYWVVVTVTLFLANYTKRNNATYITIYLCSNTCVLIKYEYYFPIICRGQPEKQQCSSCW